MLIKTTCMVCDAPLSLDDLLSGMVRISADGRPYHVSHVTVAQLATGDIDAAILGEILEN